MSMNLKLLYMMPLTPCFNSVGDPNILYYNSIKGLEGHLMASYLFSISNFELNFPIVQEVVHNQLYSILLI